MSAPSAEETPALGRGETFPGGLRPFDRQGIGQHHRDPLLVQAADRRAGAGGVIERHDRCRVVGQRAAVADAAPGLAVRGVDGRDAERLPADLERRGLLAGAALQEAVSSHLPRSLWAPLKAVRDRVHGLHPELVKLVGEQARIDLTVNIPAETILNTWQNVDGVTRVTSENGTVSVLVRDSNEALPRLFESATSQNARITSVDIREPNLEAVFLHLTGRALRD